MGGPGWALELEVMTQRQMPRREFVGHSEAVAGLRLHNRGRLGPERLAVARPIMKLQPQRIVIGRCIHPTQSSTGAAVTVTLSPGFISAEFQPLRASMPALPATVDNKRILLRDYKLIRHFIGAAEAITRAGVSASPSTVMSVCRRPRSTRYCWPRGFR